MVDLVAVSIAAGVVGVLAILHFTNGTGWEANADISKRSSIGGQPAFPRRVSPSR